MKVETHWTERIPKTGVPVQLIGNDGNAFAILGACQRAIRGTEYAMEWTAIRSEMMSGDYDHLLAVASHAFEVS